MSIVLPEIRLYLPAYRNHLTITSICLPYYQRHNCTNPPTATTLLQHPPVCHTTRDTKLLICLQQPPYHNIHMSTILPEIRLYLPFYRNHLTITSICLPYYQRHNCTNPPSYCNHLTIASTCLPNYQRHNCTYLPTAIILQ